MYTLMTADGMIDARAAFDDTVDVAHGTSGHIALPGRCCQTRLIHGQYDKV